MKRLINLFKNNKLHWFEVRFIYNKNGNRIFDFVCEVGLEHKNKCLKNRYLKKTLAPLHKQVKINNEYLNNGDLNTEILAYLGYFKK